MKAKRYETHFYIFIIILSAIGVVFYNFKKKQIIDELFIKSNVVFTKGIIRGNHFDPLHRSRKPHYKYEYKIESGLLYKGTYTTEKYDWIHDGDTFDVVYLKRKPSISRMMIIERDFNRWRNDTGNGVPQ